MDSSMNMRAVFNLCESELSLVCTQRYCSPSLTSKWGIWTPAYLKLGAQCILGISTIRETGNTPALLLSSVFSSHVFHFFNHHSFITRTSHSYPTFSISLGIKSHLLHILQCTARGSPNNKAVEGKGG